MADMIPFFPRTKAAQAVIISAIDGFVWTVDELNWLTDTAVNHMRKWESLAELRGLFCTKYKPRDGRREHCALPGFTAADSEAAYLEQQAIDTAANIERWKKELAAAPPGSEIEPFVLPPGAGPKLLQKPARAVYSPPGDPRPLAEIEAEVLRNIGPPRSPEETARLARELAEAVERRKKA